MTLRTSRHITLRIGAGAFLLGLFWGPARAHPQLAAVLEGMDRSIAARPESLGLRADRAWLRLDHNLPDSAGGDIAALLASPAWKAEGHYLQALRLFLAGQPGEAKAALRKIPRRSGDAPAGRRVLSAARRDRLLARIELALRNSGAARSAAEKAVQAEPGDEGQLLLLETWQSQGPLPKALWNRTLEEYPGHPALMEALFGFCLGGRAEPGPARCEALAALACETWWPESVDWRLRRAKVLLEAGRIREVGPVLAEALEKVDERRGGGDTEHVLALRQEIFALLKAVEAGKAAKDGKVGKSR